MYGIPLTLICILVHYDNNWSNILMGERTNAINGELFNLIITNASNFYMLLWLFIYNSNIFARNSPVITLINQLL